jgi:hypothetical protein
MAFSMLQNKFGILRLPLQCKVTNVFWLMLTLAKHHNYCINEQEGEEPTITRNGEIHELMEQVNETNRNDKDNYNRLTMELHSDGYSHL